MQSGPSSWRWPVPWPGCRGRRADITGREVLQLRRLGAGLARPADPVLSEATRARLRALGYAD